MGNKVLIYSPKTSPRLSYIISFLLRDVLLLDPEITSDRQSFISHQGPKFSYGPGPVNDEIHIQSRNLVFETGITEQNITVSDWDGLPVFYTTGKNSALPFDPFSASFYLVTRYEEYLPFLRDFYDRFETRESLAFQNKFIRQPVVDKYALLLRKLLENKFPDLIFPEKKFRYISTIDIDNAFAFKEKGILRTAGGILRNLSEVDLSELKLRLRVLSGFDADPYDTYAHQLEVQKKYGLEVIYFVLLVTNTKLRQLIKFLSDYATIGIHPSFGSNTKKEKLKIEIERLSGILHTDIVHSRQHFLKLSFPHTYRNLLEMDILNDYTMGFAHEVGFRAGTCTPFYFFDLDLEQETRLKVHPFSVMDATLKYYMKVSPEASAPIIRQIIEEVKKVNGTFISLWHNESLSDYRNWEGWKNVYEEMAKMATE
jgi:hypothetical protein